MVPASAQYLRPDAHYAICQIRRYSLIDPYEYLLDLF